VVESRQIAGSGVPKAVWPTSLWRDGQRERRARSRRYGGDNPRCREALASAVAVLNPGMDEVRDLAEGRVVATFRAIVFASGRRAGPFHSPAVVEGGEEPVER
jgi:hypothetical protein